MHQTIEKMKQLRLYQMATIHHQRMTDNLHQDYSVDEYTNMLVEQEWEENQSRKMNRLLKAAKFKAHATVSDIDFKANRGLKLDMINKLILLNFVKHNQNIILTGPAGVGKSYIAQAIGHQACINAIKVRYFNTARFLAILKFAKIENNYIKQIKALNKIPLIILDDFGLQKLDGGSLSQYSVDHFHNILHSMTSFVILSIQSPLYCVFLIIAC